MMWKRACLFAGPLVGLGLWLALGTGSGVESGVGVGAGGGVGGLTPQGKITLAIAAWMAVWWVSEAVELEATALLPLVLFPAAGLMSMKAAAAPYADPTIFFFMGGMMLGAAMERWGLPKRFALHVLLRVGGNRSMLVLGAMTATAVVSMWINNTSTCIMMLPIGMSMVRLLERGREGGERTGQRPVPRGERPVPGDEANFATAMVLGIAYAATIGGVGTLFGTAPNIILQSTAERLAGAKITFVGYAAIGFPVMALFLPMAWAVLVWLYPPGKRSTGEAREYIREELQGLGPMRGAERAVLIVLGAAVVLWGFASPLDGVLKGWLGRDKSSPAIVSEAGIAMLAAVVLFLVPARQVDGTRTTVLDWKHATGIQWGVLILFGGGLSLAEAITTTGVNTYLGEMFRSLQGVPTFVIVLAITTIVCFASEIASNTAIATTFLPIAYAGSKALGIHPYVLMFPVALAASYAYMMPMGTPPNGLAIATGRVRIGQMVRAGIILNVIAILLISTVVTVIAPRIE